MHFLSPPSSPTPIAMPDMVAQTKPLHALTATEALALLQLVLEQARSLDRISPDRRGPLHGVAVGIKDIMNTKDMPTEFGSPIYKGNRPLFDASAVSILRTAGALIFGKTRTSEFAVANCGPPTTNPHDPARTPGGSSCGSAAAVADLHVPLCLGVQTGGSVIRPASFTGVFAMKPTHNAVSLEGSKPCSPTFDTISFFARSVQDLQLVADVFALGSHDVPEKIEVDKMSIALIKTPMWAQAGPGTVVAMEEATSILEKEGATVQQVPLPDAISQTAALKRMLKVIISGEARVTFLKEYRMDGGNLCEEIRNLVENTSNTTAKEQQEASDALARIRPLVDKLAVGYTAIPAPSAPDEAPLGLKDMGSPAFNTIWTGLHTPVINIPAFAGGNGMPIGVSLISARHHDQHLLKIAKALTEPLMTGRMCSSPDSDN
ncbi:hypothetical protein RB601_002034 [Gaeumannomyces tritici]